MKRPVILSLCDHSGNWSAPYRAAGYEVVQVDIKHGGDVRLFRYRGPVRGVLAAPPCTQFASSGARWWRAKGDGPLLEALAVVDACLRIVAVHKPAWWALENPVGRLRHYLGPPALAFDPCDYGDGYTKRTLLWGDFAAPPKSPVPVDVDVLPGHHAIDAWHRKHGRYEAGRRQELRSLTPPGFARAFFAANP